MGKVSWNGGALLAPIPPVMVSCGDMDNSNIITVAWTGLLNTLPPKTYISIREKRYSYGIIKERGEFVINLTPATLVRSADFCGIYTGLKVDKFKKCGLTKEPASVVGCPLIAECPLSIECRVTQIIPLGSHDMFMADIVAVNVDEALIDKSGRLNIKKANLAAFAHGEYFELGRSLGTFGFSVRKNKKGRLSAEKSTRLL
jgi:flavin reductase (DIM6/NTAB) family NADH-FMN oxidoreductase RutF